MTNAISYSALDGAGRPAVAAAGIFGAGRTPTRFLDRPDGRIAYDDAGSGPLVVMVPGLGDLRQEYRFLAERLVAAGYRTVTVDLRGHGETSVGWPDHRPVAIGTDVVALLRHLDAGPAFLIGTSMGAAAVTAAAADAPDLVRGIVLIGPFLRDVRPDSWLKALVQWLMIKIGLGGPWAPRAWGGYLESLYPSQKPADWAAYRAAVVANLKEPGRMAAAKAMIAPGQKEGLEPKLAALRSPALVIMGTKDADFPDPKREAEAVAGMVRGDVVLIEGAGHYPHAEMPEKAAAPILAFLTRHRG